jgi:hypothetical protein
MLFTESDLQMVGNPMAVLNEATYLDEDEAIIRPQTIPVSENSRIGAYTVRFDDVHRLAESHGVDYVDAVVAIAEASGVDPSYLKVAVDESEIIVNPDVVFALPQNGVVVAPLSEQSVAFRYVNECISLWDQMPDTDESDMALAEALIDDTYLEQFLNEGIMDTIKGAASSVADKARSAGGAISDFYTRDFRQGAKAMEARKNVKDALAIKDDPSITDEDRKQWEKRKDKYTKFGIKAYATGAGKVAATAAAVGAAGYGLKKFYNYLHQADDKPKTWIGQKIAALRKVYQAWMQKAEKGGPGVGAKIKQAAAKLLSIIDALMAKMQKAAG